MTSVLSDITTVLHSQNPSVLQWVGMEGIALPIQIPLAQGEPLAVNVQADVLVNLRDRQSKGIHMSRLYRLVIGQLASKTITPERLELLLTELIESQQGMSSAAKVVLRGELLLPKKALISEAFGFSRYPFELVAQQHLKEVQLELTVSLLYSSTCPCSAALSRDLYRQAVEAKFSDDLIEKSELLAWLAAESGTVATPHSQRSQADVTLKFATGQFMAPDQLITRLEQVISTPVQTAVKRADEQAFARINAENLMFCEDAARRFKAALSSLPELADFTIKVEHQESLHGHNAVAYASSDEC